MCLWPAGTDESFLDLTDKKTANLFADGAGAAVLGWEINRVSWPATCWQWGIP